MSIWPLLYSRYPAGEYAIMQEVSDAAGFGRSRSADGIVMNLWPSRGLELSGIECKSSRSDWLRELKNPKKAENIFKYCDRWWLVTDTEEIAKAEEIPKTWGWMCGNKNGTRIIVKKEAPLLKAEQCSRQFLAAMMKRISQGMIHKSTLEDEIEKRVGEREARDKQRVSYELKSCREDLEQLQKRISDFEKVSGVTIDRWDSGNIAKIVGVLRKSNPDDMMIKLYQLRDSSEDIYNRILAGIKELENNNGVQKQNHPGQ